jgi:hypothetical protein
MQYSKLSFLKSLTFSFLLVGLSGASVFAQGEPVTEADYQKKFEELERKILEIILATGGAETAFRKELEILRKELQDTKDEYRKVFNRPNLERTNHGWFSGFFQNQYVDNSNGGPLSDGFRSRRQRLNYNHIGDSRTMGRISIEFAAGVNQTTTQIRDAFIQYRPGTYLKSSGPTYTIGGQNTPIGYEIAYPSWARTWPERSIYNQVFFNGERGRGALYQNGDASNYWYAGIWNGITVNDFEAVNNPNGPGTGAGPTAGFHVRFGDFSGGLSFLSAERPAFGQFNSSEGREFTYFEFQYKPRKSRFDFRGEIMRGSDRLPNVSTSRRNVSGGHLTLDYILNNNDILVARYESFDSNTALGGSLTDAGNINLYGLGMVRDVNPFLRLTIAQEWVSSSSYLRGYQALTLRAQYRF